MRWVLRAFSMLALVALGIAACNSVPEPPPVATAPGVSLASPDGSTLRLLESLQARARSRWAHSRHDPGFAYPTRIRPSSEPERHDDDDPSVEGAVRDRWGQTIRLRIPGLDHFRGYDLWSCGPNREDEDGRGDDILIGEDLESEDAYTMRVLHSIAARICEAKPIAAAGDARDPTGLATLARELQRQGIHGTHAIRFECVRTDERVGGNYFGGSNEPIEAGDAWNHLVRYRCPGPVHPKGWDVYSLGPNGRDDHGDANDLVIGEDFP
jgi:hypothetical protein